MKKTLIVTLLVVVALSVIGVGAAYAQGGQPPLQKTGSGILHDYIVQAFADHFDLEAEDVNASLAAGTSLYQMALDQGVAAEDIPALMLEIRTAALQQAVADGIITQERADWMIQRMQSMRQAGPGIGSAACPMGAGTYTRTGAGRGMGGRLMHGFQTNP
ncbi:MAG: hypothetical protein FJZ96_15890 [Chloroflexi bacterium]|nr:hypothetical protein [Chloroflexota bacterium]